MARNYSDLNKEKTSKVNEDWNRSRDYSMKDVKARSGSIAVPCFSYFAQNQWTFYKITLHQTSERNEGRKWGWAALPAAIENELKNCLSIPLLMDYTQSHHNKTKQAKNQNTQKKPEMKAKTDFQTAYRSLYLSIKAETIANDTRTTLCLRLWYLF